MKTATVKELKAELIDRSHHELIELCIRLSRFKKENKELLSYLLFESANEEDYIISIKREIDEQFEMINTTSYYYIKKRIRKILRTIKKYIRYSKSNETEIELLLYFCKKLKNFTPSIHSNILIKNMYHRETLAIKKKITVLHEDLQYDYKLELQKLYF
jgi:vacuolar-type H+-ATPase catalytic subunit A/Vma1